MIPKNILKKLYQKGLSLSDIAKDLKVSVHAVSYWMDKYGLQRRSIRKKNKFGVLQIACHNTKLKNIVDEMLRSLKDSYISTPM